MHSEWEIIQQRYALFCVDRLIAIRFENNSFEVDSLAFARTGQSWTVSGTKGVAHMQPQSLQAACASHHYLLRFADSIMLPFMLFFYHMFADLSYGIYLCLFYIILILKMSQAWVETFRSRCLAC